MITRIYPRNTFGLKQIAWLAEKHGSHFMYGPAEERRVKIKEQLEQTRAP